MILALSVFVLVACGSEEDGNEAIIDEAEAFIEHLENGDFEAASGYFSDEMKEQLSAEELEQVYGELNEMLGELVSYEYSDMQVPEEGVQSLIFAAEFETTSASLIVTFDDHQEIIGFFVQ